MPNISGHDGLTPKADCKNSAPTPATQNCILLTPRIRAIVDEAIDRAEAHCRDLGLLGLAARALLQAVEVCPAPYSIHNLNAIAEYDAFKSLWPRSFLRLKGTLWQPRNGHHEPIGEPWRFKQYDALLIEGAWQYAGESVCSLYDDRGPGDRYWLRLARAVNATVHPARYVRLLLSSVNETLLAARRLDI